MAGITHSAFRRLLSDFGGCGALYTEMLPARSVLSGTPRTSPATRRRPAERKICYQLLLHDPETVAPTVEALRPLHPDAIDLNLGCPAPEVVRRGGGTALAADRSRLQKVLRVLRSTWQGTLLVKFRLGNRHGPWREQLTDRIRLFEQEGVDALVVHARFTRDKVKRVARWDELPRLSELTALPVIGNGDIMSAEDVREKQRRYPMLSGIMVGRMAVVKPWLFSQLAGRGPADPDYEETWERFYRYTLEDFPPQQAIGRIKEFTAYYSRNFLFGHDLYRAAQGASSLDILHERAVAFLSRRPQAVRHPSLGGI
jgi:tRNA-dihydrouridine synthase